MKRQIRHAVLAAACVFAMSSVGLGQTPDVTFKVPLNVTRLPPDITKVEVDCTITSPALPPRTANGPTQATAFQDLPVSGGQIVTTATVVVPIPSLNTSAPGGTSASYSCRLTGFSQPLNQWGVFSDSQTIPAFRISPTPAAITGTFNW